MTTEPAISEEVIEQGISIANQQATSLQVVDAVTYEQAGTLLKGIKTLKANIQEYFKPLKDAAHKAHKAITAKESEELEKLEPAMKHLSDTMTTWKTEQERLESIKREKEAAEQRKIEEDRRLAEASLAEQAGDTAEAEAIISAPIHVSAPVIQSAVPKVAGLAMKSTWSAEVTDLKALVMAIAQGKAPIECIEANMTFLNGQARALKSNLRYPGVVAREKKSMAGSR